MRGALLAAAAAVLAGCASAAGATLGENPASAAAALAGADAPVAGSPIKHVIVLIQENRTFNNLFASSILNGGKGYPGAETTQVANIGGKKIRLLSTPFEYPADPDHSHPSLVAEWNDGAMDGFPNDQVYANPGFPSPPPNFTISYVPQYETIVYHQLAQRYALADRNFSPRLAPTFPGHNFLVAGRSLAADDPTDPVTWGCDSKAGTTVPTFGQGEREHYPGVFPCFDFRTIADLMNEHGVSWRYYTGAIDNTVDAAVNVYDAMKRIRYSASWTNGSVSTPMSNVLSDIQNCRLPSVAYVTPTWLNSDHAGNLTDGGPGWIGSIYLAIEQSRKNGRAACRYYGSTAMIVVWDDSGGWYDEVAPPPGPGQTHWGFRVPLIVISAWAKSNWVSKGAFTPYVSHTMRESTSILRYIEKNWNLGNLGQRDASGDALEDLFDYKRPAQIPPISELVVKAGIARTHFDLARSLHDTHVVDDDR